MGGQDFDNGWEVVGDSSAVAKGTIGAARKRNPYWTLLDAQNRPWARLGLWFTDEETAVRETWRLLKEECPEVLPHGIQQRLRDVEISCRAQVAKLKFDQLLVLQLQEATRGDEAVRTPPALLSAEFDVAQVVRQGFPYAYDLTIVTERALAEGRVRCTAGKEFIFRADAVESMTPTPPA
jgi:hypothetical protein